MSFKLIEKIGTGPRPATGVAIGSATYSAGVSTAIRLSPDILDTMGWSPGCRLGLSHGDGRDKGKLRIGIDDLNGFKLLGGAARSQSKRVWCARIGDGKKHKTQTVPHKIINGHLYIDLPDWALPNG